MRQDDGSAAYSLPVHVGDILEGEVIRIEKYGAFCSLITPNPKSSTGTGSGRPPRPPQGLIHISQLHDGRVERVEDVVSLQDHVWVKVLEVEHGDETNAARLRIRLSMKDAAQDGSRQDLGRQRERVEQAKSQLETNLNSMIGMGVARDPMQNLVIKNQRGEMSSSSAMTFRGGYSLVDDDEGEPDQPSSIISSRPDGPGSSSGHNTNTLALTPMGRGRGATLPAWMTSQQSRGPHEGPTGVANAADCIGSKKIGGDRSDDDARRKRKRHKSRRHDSKHGAKRKRKRHSRRHDHRRYDSDCSDSNSDGSSPSEPRCYGKESDRKHRQAEKKKKRRRSPSLSSESETGDSMQGSRDNRKHTGEKDDDREKWKSRRSRSQD
jgi:predicted RNA-binding protein with RPS1 domain